jgi:subfamily B ATP-binding cassette protein MsbA
MLKVLKYFANDLKKFKKEYLFIIFGVVATATATVFTAHIIKPILDNIFIEKNREMLFIIPFFLVLIYSIKSLGRYLQGYFTAFIGEKIVMDLRNRMLDKILSFDFEYINSIRNGELISRINNDIFRVKYIVSEMIPEFLREAVTIFALIIYVIYQNPILAFYTLVILPATFYPLTLLAKKMKATSIFAQEKNADIVSKLNELFNNIEIIKAHSTENYELNDFQEENNKLFQITMRGVKIFQFVSPMMEIYSSFSIALVIIFGGTAVIDGEMSVGTFFAFLTAVGLLFDPIKKISAIFNKMQDGISATERIIKFLDINSKIIDGDEVLDKIKTIEFKNVSFEFQDKLILQNINFKIQSGDKIAFVGESGGGKSTILNLILRFYDVKSGEILINGINIKKYKIASLRNQISFLSQRVYIFNDTVLKNVAYGSNEKDINKEKVILALKTAEAWDFVEKMEFGLNTVLNEFGTNLSGGQRQRIALARAFYKNSSLIILDEATSSLDNKIEKMVLNNIDKVLKNKILITVAHRQSAIQHSDKLIKFNNGQII